MTWQKILWKLGSPAALSYARSATGRQNRAPSVWAAFQVQGKCDTVRKFHNNTLHKIPDTKFRTHVLGGASSMSLPKTFPTSWTRHHKTSGLCDPTESIEGITATFNFQLQSTEAIGKFPVFGSKPGFLQLCWNVLGWTVVAWIYDQMQRCQKKIITIQSIWIDFIVQSISCTEITSRKRNAFLFRYLLGRTLSIYTGVHFLSQCLVPLKITDFGNLLDMYKAFCWTHGVSGLAVNVGNVRIQVTHVNLRTSLGITSQSRPVWTHKGYHQTDAGLETSDHVETFLCPTSSNIFQDW